MGKHIYKIITAIVFTLFMVTFMKEPVSAATSSNWVWPTTYHIIKNDWPRYSNGSYHSGTDFPVALNTPVYSTCDGTVVAVTSLTTSYGKHIKIRATVNGNTVYMRYCHLNSFAISNGAEVKAGQLIGYSGSTGNSTGPHLHYEVRNANDYYGNANSPTLNPRNYLPGSAYSFTELSINSGNNNGFGYDYPLNNQEIMDDNFRFQGWVKTSKKIKDITCSVNDGEHYVTAGLYTRPDVPGATAFLTNVSSDLLNYGINKISVCVNYTDGTGEVAGVRTVRKIKPKVLCGYDYPTDYQTITDNEFLFQGWVSVDKNIKNITCSINDGEHYIIAKVYDRPDVPYARAFRATINSELLNYGNNYVSVCVNYTDGTGETVGRRVVNKNIIDALDFPEEEAVVTNDEEVLLQGWSYSGSKHIDHFVYWLNGESYQMNAYVRDDLLEGARAFRKKIPNIQFANGENVIRVDAWYSDGTVRQVISRRINGDFRVKKVTLDKTNTTLTRKGEAVSLVATVEPSNAGNNAITWCSSNAAVATVNNSGVVTAVSHGTAIITAKTSDGNKTAESRVTVNILIELKEAALETTNYIYDGLPKTPAVTVKNGTTTLVKGTDYEITYSNNINAGIATATIIGKGNYTGKR